MMKLKLTEEEHDKLAVLFAAYLTSKYDLKGKFIGDIEKLFLDYVDQLKSKNANP